MLARRFLSLAGSRRISETAASFFIKGCTTLSEPPPDIHRESCASLTGNVDVLHWNRDNLLSSLNSLPAREWNPAQVAKTEGAGNDDGTQMFPLLHLLREASPSGQTYGEKPDMLADSTKRKRKKKMNKHKHRKRIKKLRHQKKR